jgi:16S rRNA (cytidine1402-2'-O)-methyltransferase
MELSCLYLVPTPIGNPGDISRRALETLSAVDFIAAENESVAVELLARHGISKLVVSCHEHNAAARSREIIERIKRGETCALVSDAGTPAVSDPGGILVSDCVAEGIPVKSLPGPCAAICALAASGLGTNRFCFEGFLSVSKKSRRERLEDLKSETRTMIFYEAPQKLLYTLRDMRAAFGDRRLTLCRDLTKSSEAYLRTTLSGALSYFENETPKGEYVLVLSGAEPGEKTPPEAGGKAKAL